MENFWVNHILENLEDTYKYDTQFDSGVDIFKGWKLSIQGKSLDDSRFLIDRLVPYLVKEEIPFKVGTKKRIETSNKVQARKLFTIYCPSDTDIKDLAESVYTKIKNYKGWQNIKTPPKYEHYAGGIFYRNDRDKNGRYIPGK